MNEGVMKYGGYSTKVVYSPEDECLIGSVLGIADNVTFHGDSVEEIRQAFQVAVDEYLKACEKLGKTPDRPYSGRMLIRLPVAVHASVSQLAEATGRSANQLVVDAVTSVYCNSDGENETSNKPRRLKKNRP